MQGSRYSGTHYVDLTKETLKDARIEFSHRKQVGHYLSSPGHGIFLDGQGNV